MGALEAVSILQVSGVFWFIVAMYQILTGVFVLPHSPVLSFHALTGHLAAVFI